MIRVGLYLNYGNKSFQDTKASEIFVDKSLLIEYTNTLIFTKNKNICMTRPRRFGKSTDARMLVAYYDHSCNSSELFHDLNISLVPSYKKYLNACNVVLLNIQEFFSNSSSIDEMIQIITEELCTELIQEIHLYHPSYTLHKFKPIKHAINTLHELTNRPFICVIDEWDCLLRSTKKVDYELYLDFLRDLLKDQSYIDLVYMTGILPIKKYGTHSALNAFDEISMMNASPLSLFMGFTQDEVEKLCTSFNMDFKMMQSWYDGYHLDNHISVYSPKSVISAISKRKYAAYWTTTETYEALKSYITMNFDGLRDDVIRLLTGEKIDVNIGKFQNDMTTFKSKDDVFALLIHLGYLGYDNVNEQVYIPNREVMDSFVDSIEDASWGNVTKLLLNSQALLTAIWNCDGEKVSRYIEDAHLETSILQYNDENALAYTIYLALIASRNHYTVIRELPTGKGFADLAFLPLKDKPAMLIELKWDKDVKSALDQIKQKQYPKALEHYQNDVLIVGINYDKDTKKHSCIIEKLTS